MIGFRLLNRGARFYVVQRGDTLIGIASRHGLDWRNLARANCLRTPDLIFSGQLIHFPEVA